MRNPLSAISRRIIRFRRTRGFGVHSPFAFGFITSVLNSPYPYYAFESLAADIAHAGGSLRPADALTLFRVLDQFMPRIVTVMPADDNDAVMVIRRWNATCTITSDPTSFIIITDDGGQPAGIDPAAGPVIFFGRGAMASFHKVKALMERGMTFTNGKTAIAVCSDRLPRQDFEISY